VLAAGVDVLAAGVDVLAAGVDVLAAGVEAGMRVLVVSDSNTAKGAAGAAGAGAGWDVPVVEGGVAVDSSGVGAGSQIASTNCTEYTSVLITMHDAACTGRSMTEYRNAVSTSATNRASEHSSNSHSPCRALQFIQWCVVCGANRVQGQ